MKSSPPWTAAALVAVTGCSDPAESVETPTTFSITAREVTTLRATTGATHETPVDLDTAVVQAYARDAAGTWTAYAGEGASDGTLGVHDVPLGSAWLRVDYPASGPEGAPRNELFLVDGAEDRALDLGTWRTGRTGIAFATQVPTEVVIQMSGLSPWQPGLDLAVMYAPNVAFAQVFAQDGDGITGMPANGGTATSLHVDWASALAAPLLDGTRGDETYAMQFRFREMNGVYVGAPIRAAKLPPFTQHDGIASEVVAPLDEIANPLRVRVAVDRTAFDSYRPAMGRAVSQAFGRGFAISAAAEPVTADFSLESSPAELVVVDNDMTGGGLFDLGDIDVASPFPREHVFGHFVSGYAVLLERDDGFSGGALAEIGVITHELPTQGTPVTPIIAPVRNVTVAGRPAFDAPTGVGLTPTIAWDAPLLGTAVEYEVKILAPGGADPRYDFLWYPSATFHVPGDRTSLELPPEILEPDLPYAIAIRAITHAVSAEERANAPRRLALPYGWADTITPAFKP